MSSPHTDYDLSYRPMTCHPVIAAEISSLVSDTTVSIIGLLPEATNIVLILVKSGVVGPVKT